MKNKELKKTLALALKKASGTLAKVESMAEEEADCLAVVQQMDAVIGLIEAARRKLVKGRLEECFRRSSGGKASEHLQELLRLYEVGRK
jgi:DNA-binding FrmR family transcriptional regulator